MPRVHERSLARSFDQSMEVSEKNAFEPTTWLLIFNHEASTWWRSFLAFGQFKHVWACAYVPDCNSWLVYDVHLDGTTIGLVPAGPLFNQFLGYRTGGLDRATIVSMPRQPARKMASPLILIRRVGFWCVPAVSHLIGLQCVVLRPDALYRACLRLGGKPFEDVCIGTKIPTGADRPRVCAVDADEPAAGYCGNPDQVAG